MIYKILLPVFIIVLFTVLWLGGGGEYLMKNYNALLSGKKTAVQVMPPPASPIENKVSVTPITTTPTLTISKLASNIPEGWLTYNNTKYGFSVSYPSNYKAITSKDELYGWDKAVVLLYSGGQSYDIAVEVWDSEAEYKEKYPEIKLTVFSAKGKIITIYDETKEPENKAIINSFTLTN